MCEQMFQTPHMRAGLQHPAVAFMAVLQMLKLLKVVLTQAS